MPGSGGYRQAHREDLHPELLAVDARNSTPTNPERGDDPRLGSWFAANDVLAPGGVALIGFPCDIGVARNGGRPGAAQGPAAIRRALGRLTPDARNAGPFVSLLERSVDLGDIVAPRGMPDGHDDSDADADVLLLLQRRLGRVVEAVLRAGGIPVVLGGGHETAFGHYLGSRAVFDQITIINWDAHPDVRPLLGGLGHSGSPFRQALELDFPHRLHYVVAGLQPRAVSTAHVRYVNSRGRCFFAEELDATVVDAIYEATDRPVQVSFDLDAVDGSEAPGVSAPSVGGLSSRDWMHLAEKAGRCQNVKSIDVVELNPRFDTDGRTARLAAGTVWSFMSGLARRHPDTTSHRLSETT